MRFILTSVLILVLLSLVSGCAQEPDIKVENQLAKPSPMGPGVYSAFMDLHNSGGMDILTGFTVEGFPNARCEMHDVKDGKMFEVPEIKVVGSSKVELKRGSLHLMMFEMPEAADLPEKLTLVLNFKKSGPITVEAQVEGVAGAEAMETPSSGGMAH